MRIRSVVVLLALAVLELTSVGWAAITDPVKVEQGLLAAQVDPPLTFAFIVGFLSRRRRSAICAGKRRSLRPAGREHAKLQNSPMHAGRRRIRRQPLSTRRTSAAERRLPLFEYLDAREARERPPAGHDLDSRWRVLLAASAEPALTTARCWRVKAQSL